MWSKHKPGKVSPGRVCSVNTTRILYGEVASGDEGETELSH